MQTCKCWVAHGPHLTGRLTGPSRVSQTLHGTATDRACAGKLLLCSMCKPGQGHYAVKAVKGCFLAMHTPAYPQGPPDTTMVWC